MTEDERERDDAPEAAAGKQAGAPKPGVKPGAKRRRTASMKVSRPEPVVADGAQPVADGAQPTAEQERPPGPFEGAWVGRLRQFLDSTPGRVALAVSAVAGLALGPTGIYSVFALMFLFRRRLRPLVARLPLGPRTTLGVLIVLAGLVRELLSWTAEYVQGDQAVLLLWHPQLVPDLLIGLGIFLGWALGWAAALRWYRYSLIEVLFIQAVYGLVIENFGQSLIIGITTLPSGLVVLLNAVLLSSCTVGTAWLLAGDKLATLPAKEAGSFRYAAPPVLITLAIVLILMVWGQALAAINGIPDPAPIRDRPFW